MRNIIFTVLSLATILILVGCTSSSQPELKGSYQSEKDVNGYFVQIAILQDENSFIEYIDNREVDRGTYKKAENNKYTMKSDRQDFEINLNEDNSFGIIVKKLNNGKPIKMVNIDDVPTTFPSQFDDVEEYKALLGE